MIPDMFADAVARSRQGHRATRKSAKQPKTTKPIRTQPLEKDEQAQLFRWAGCVSVTHPELVTLHAIPNAGGYAGGYGNNLARVQAAKREGVRAGVPDIHLPVARGGYCSLYIELKRQNATASAVSERQRDWHIRLCEAGNAVHVCCGWEAARDVILEYLSMPPWPSRPAGMAQPTTSQTQEL